MSLVNEFLKFKDNIKQCNTLIYNEEGAAEPVGDGEFKYTKLSEFMKELLKREKNTIAFKDLQSGFKQLFPSNPMWDDFDLSGIIKTAIEFDNKELLLSYYELGFEYFGKYSENFHESLEMLFLSKKFLIEDVFRNEADLYIKEVYSNYDNTSSQKYIDLNRVTEGLIKEVTLNHPEFDFCENIFNAMMDNPNTVYESILHIKQSIEEVFGKESFSILYDYIYSRNLNLQDDKINELIDDGILSLKTRIDNPKRGGWTIFNILQECEENYKQKKPCSELYEKIYQRKDVLIQNMMKQIISLDKNEELRDAKIEPIDSAYIIPFVGIMENKELNKEELEVAKILFKSTLERNQKLDIIVPFVFSNEKNGVIYNQVFNEDERHIFINQIIQSLDYEFNDILQCVVTEDSFYTRTFRDSLKIYHSLAKYFMDNIESEKKYSKALDIMDGTIKKTFNVNAKVSSSIEEKIVQLMNEINIMRDDVKMRKEIPLVQKSVTQSIKKIKM